MKSTRSRCASRWKRILHPVGVRRIAATVDSIDTARGSVATEMVGRMRTHAERCGAADQVRMVLVDRAAAVGAELGAGPRPAIRSALDELGVEVRTGRLISSMDPDRVHLDDGTQIPARTVVWTAGAVFTTEWERTVHSTGAEAKQRKRMVNEQWIYPPTDDAAEILRRAHYMVSTRQPTPAE